VIIKLWSKDAIVVMTASSCLFLSILTRKSGERDGKLTLEVKDCRRHHSGIVGHKIRAKEGDKDKKTKTGSRQSLQMSDQ
jgi:hypothetical protein